MIQKQLLVTLGILLVSEGVIALQSDTGQQVLVDSQDKFVRDVYQVRKELKEAEIIPTVLDEFLPSLLVNVEWSSSNYAQLGNTLKPKKLQDAPSITLAYPESSPESHSSSFLNTTYIITITDPDAPSRDDPKWSEFCHWIATGLPISQKRPQPLYASSNNNNNNDNTLELTSNLEEVMPYYPPGPPEKTGKHRYVFLIFIPENGTTEPLELSKPGDRRHWGYDYEGERVGVRKWSEENGLVPVAANFIYSQNKNQ